MKKIGLFFCAAGAALSAGCGFTPVLSDNGRLGAKTRDIYIAPISGTTGIDLRNRLIVAWNTPSAEGARYTLAVKLDNPTTIYKGLQTTGAATWEEVRLEASWTLSENGAVIARSHETASESYTFVSDLISANAAKTTAISNAINSIGDKIEMKVNARLNND